jgi:phenylacetate-CoA ligase
MVATMAEPGLQRRTQAGRPYFHRNVETLPRERLVELQLARLKATARNAYDHVPLYRTRFDAVGLDPADIRRAEDIRALPYTVKNDLRDAYPFGLFARPRQELVRLHASSGTTGKPTVVGYTEHDIDVWAGLMARSMMCAGARRGDVVHNAYGYGLFTGGLGAHFGGERLGATVVPMSGGSTEKQVQLIQDFGARVLCATPSYALAIAEVAEQMGVDLARGTLEVGLFGAEPWSEAMRVEIERRLGVKAIDVYGLSEIMGPGVAIECEWQAGLHGWEDNFLFELLDPETGRPVPEGEAGELVITTLTKEALPMLRYRTRDITRVTTAPCACGRTHLRILRVSGRTDDMLIIRGVNVYPSQVEAVLVGQPGVGPHYQIVIERRGSLDDVRIDVEAEPELPRSQYDETAAALGRRVKSLIGITTVVTMVAPGAIERSTGKAKRVRDLRPK